MFFFRGKRLFNKRAVTLIMCARDCLTNGCYTGVNYNPVIQRCVGISSEIDTSVERSMDWELWQMYYMHANKIEHRGSEDLV